MLLLLLAAVVLFVLLPLDAQLVVVGALRWLWLSEAGRSLAMGGLGAMIVALFWYWLGWNALAWRLYVEEDAKARDNYQKRRR